MIFTEKYYATDETNVKAIEQAMYEASPQLRNKYREKRSMYDMSKGKLYTFHRDIMNKAVKNKLIVQLPHSDINGNAVLTKQKKYMETERYFPCPNHSHSGDDIFDSLSYTDPPYKIKCIDDDTKIK